MTQAATCLTACMGHIHADVLHTCRLLTCLLGHPAVTVLSYLYVSIIFVGECCLQAHLWWAAAGSGLRCALIALLDDLPPDLPLLLLATAELATDPAATAAAVGQQRQQQLRLAAAAAASSSSNAQLQQQQQQDLEALGIEPSLAALFPALGSFEELLQSPQQHSMQQQQQQVAAAAGCGVLGRVLLGQMGPAERRGMFKVSHTPIHKATKDNPLHNTMHGSCTPSAS